MELFISILSFISSFLTILNFRRREKDEPSSSAFESVELDQLSKIISTPVRVSSQRIERDPPIKLDSRCQIILGTSGVGKTRTACDIINVISDLTQASNIYYAKGYVDALTPLPERATKRKVIVFIDDYDYGFVNASDISFDNRQAASAQAVENLKNLYININKKVEVCGFVVTINSHRIPLEFNDINRALPNFDFYELKPISSKEYNEFLESLCHSLEIILDNNAKQILKKANNGRFDTISIFLSKYPRHSKLNKQDAEKYLKVQHSIWEVFYQNLSVHQMLVYNCVKIIKDFGLPPRIEYLYEMSRKYLNGMNDSQIRMILASLWEVHDDQAIIYDGEFAETKPQASSSEFIVKSCLAAGKHLKKDKRYSYQREMKELLEILLDISQDKLALKLLLTLHKWYPKDRYFTYMLSLIYFKRKQYLRAIWPLFHIFRNPNIFVIYSGKWIEIRAHLLLAAIYEDTGLDYQHNWAIHKRIEAEYEQAAYLADFEISDSFKYEYVGSYKIKRKNKTEEVIKDREKEKSEKTIENYIHELGYIPSEGISLNATRLRALVHNAYASYLNKKMQQEYLSIKHEQIVIDILPDFGEAYLTSAYSCLKLGNSKKALTFLDQAESAAPQNMDLLIYNFMISRYRIEAYADLGNLTDAKINFSKCLELSKSEPIKNNKPLIDSLLSISNDKDYWDRHTRLAIHREKTFSDSIHYSLPLYKLEIVLPQDWKIIAEKCSNTDESDYIIAIFGSPLTWNDTIRIPEDASVNLFYSTDKKFMDMDVDMFGNWWIQNERFSTMQSNYKYIYNIEQQPINLGNAMFCKWTFHILGKWPKVGRLMAFNLPNARIMLHFMTEYNSIKSFSPLFDSIENKFINQNILKLKQ